MKHVNMSTLADMCRASIDGVTQFMPSLFSCGGLACKLLSRVSYVAHLAIAKLSRHCSSMFIATWSMTSLFKSEGSVETAHQTMGMQLAEDSRIDLVMSECIQ